MEDIVRLKLIEPHESNAIYRDVYQSYKEVYNNSMAKGKGNLTPKFMGGNPIQLDSGNMNSLFKINGSELSYNDYFVSTKANGLRFMLLIGNKAIDKSRNIYLIDSRMNFWTINQDGSGDLPPIPLTLNVDKCLIDGELLFWGQVSTRIVKNEIKEYIISKTRNHKPLIAFLAFDILYGPINPDYVKSKQAIITSHERHYELGGSGAMVGPKALGRWPFSRRRHVLEEIFLNVDSPLWEYLHKQSEYVLNKIVYGRQGDKIIVKNQTHFNFTIFVSPFVKMNELFDKYSTDEIYPVMRKVLHSSIKEQYFYIKIENMSKYMLTLPPTPDRTVHNMGKGYSTDGIILNPANESYIMGPWTFCNNKQYKWKPVNQLTIDFEIGEEIGQPYEDDEGIHYFYSGMVKQSKKIVKFEYKIDSITYLAAIEAKTPLVKKTIVECLYSGSKQNDANSNYLIFNIDQIRYDKSEPNALLTAVSVLNASNMSNELDFLKNKKDANVSVLDLVVLLKNSKTLTPEQKENVLISFGKDKLLKCYISRYPQLLFEKHESEILNLIKQKQQNESYELELRLDFGSRYNYANCLTNKLLGSEYTPVPIVKVFDKNNKESTSTRSVYVLLGDVNNLTNYNMDSLILEETIEKKQIKTMKIHDDIYNYMFSMVLSEEINSDKEIKHGSKNAGNSEYQNRYTITNLSDFWRVDIIEYGNSKDIIQAQKNWEQKPNTRVEIEYAPASYIEDILKWENPEALKLIFNEISKNTNIDMNINDIVDKKEILLDKLAKYKRRLNNTNPQIVLKELAKVLITLFNTLDMDLGNASDYTEKEKKRAQREQEQEQEVVEQVDEIGELFEKTTVKMDIKPGTKPDTKEGLFSRLRAFHNSIKEELIEEVASRCDKPISLLDISVGKGGDLFKWNKVNKSGYPDIDTVYGIDPDENSIKEANKRLAEAIKLGKIKSSRNYKFEQLAIGDSTTIIQGKYDIVSCQFTLHYFFKNFDILRRVLEKISNSLKPGGYFIGTTMVKENVKKLIMENKFPNEIELEQIDDKSYRMKFNDPDVYSSKLPEYYVNFDEFTKECERYGLKKIVVKKFSEIYKNYKKTLKNKSNVLRPYEQAVSELNVSFIFMKK